MVVQMKIVLSVLEKRIAVTTIILLTVLSTYERSQVVAITDKVESLSTQLSQSAVQLESASKRIDAVLSSAVVHAERENPGQVYGDQFVVVSNEDAMSSVMKWYEQFEARKGTGNVLHTGRN